MVGFVSSEGLHPRWSDSDSNRNSLHFVHFAPSRFSLASAASLALAACLKGLASALLMAAVSCGTGFWTSEYFALFDTGHLVSEESSALAASPPVVVAGLSPIRSSCGSGRDCFASAAATGHRRGSRSAAAIAALSNC